MRKLALIAPLALLLGACQAPSQDQASTSMPAPAASVDQPAAPPPPAQASLADKLQPVLAGDWRSPEHKARDQYRHPQETLAFFGVDPAMTLVEITPGGGWYTEILAPLLQGSGRYVAAVGEPSNPDGEDAQSLKSLQALFDADPAHFSDAEIVTFDPQHPQFGPAGSADIVVTFRNGHNWVGAGTASAMFQGFYDVLKPGGTLGFTDHRASADKSLDEVKGTGYLPVADVIGMATEAGFVLDARSEINANPKDNHDHPKGVWTLPPTLTLGDQDRDKYLAIGESDRMTLRFVKPQADAVSDQGNDAAKQVTATASAGQP